MPRGAPYVIALLACALVLLLKISHAFLALPIAYLFFLRFRWRAVIHWECWVFAVGAFLPAAYLYLIRGTHVSEGLGTMALNNTFAIFSNWSFLSGMLSWFGTRHFWTVWTPLGTGLLLVGLLNAVRQNEPRARRLSNVLIIWLLGWVYYWIFAGQMSGHLYYQGPSLPIAAAFMGLALAQLGRVFSSMFHRAAVILVIACFIVLNGAVQSHNREDINHWREPWDRPPLIAGLAADRQLPASAKIVAGTIAPLKYSLFYFSHRDGWFIPFNEANVEWEVSHTEAPALLERRRQEGAAFYVAAFTPDRKKFGGASFTRGDFDALPIGQHLLERYPLIDASSYYAIFDLRGEQQEGVAHTEVSGFVPRLSFS